MMITPKHDVYKFCIHFVLVIIIVPQTCVVTNRYQYSHSSDNTNQFYSDNVCNNIVSKTINNSCIMFIILICNFICSKMLTRTIAQLFN